MDEGLRVELLPVSLPDGLGAVRSDRPEKESNLDVPTATHSKDTEN